MLRIYISQHCRGCARARALAAQVRVLRPALAVELVDIDTATALPPAIIGTPVYTWEQQILFLGNPRLDELLEALDGYQPA